MGMFNIITVCKQMIKDKKVQWNVENMALITIKYLQINQV